MLRAHHLVHDARTRDGAEGALRLRHHAETLLEALLPVRDVRVSVLWGVQGN